MNKNTEYYKKLLKKYGTNEAVEAMMTEAYKKRTENRRQNGAWKSGFTEMDKEKLREVARQGAYALHRKRKEERDGKVPPTI